MTLKVPPMLPEDRKHLDVPPMPMPGTSFQYGGQQWILVGIQGELSLGSNQRLSLEFISVDSDNPVIPV